MSISKNCRKCGNLFWCKPSHVIKKFYCSKNCMAEDYKIRLKGESNPNFKRNYKICLFCEKKYKSYKKNTKFCSVKCYNFSPLGIDIQKKASGIARIVNSNKPKKIKEKIIKIIKVRKKRELKPKVIPIPNKVCFLCQKDYHSYNKKRQYCSYKCAINSGSSYRAGMSAAMKRIKYGAKKDINHKEIVDILSKMFIPFYDLSNCGCGVPDGIAWVKEAWHFVEIKNPKTAYGRRGLNKNQKKWISEWKGGGVYILRSIDDAVNFANGKFETLEYHCRDSKEDEIEINNRRFEKYNKFSHHNAS